MNNKNTFKLVLLGQSSVGKTSINLRLTKNNFINNFETTIGVAFNRKTFNDNDKLYHINIWDTAGQERYISLTPIYFRNANIILLVFDLNDLETINYLDHNIKQILQMNKKHTYQCIFIGNKLDLVKKEYSEKIINNIKNRFKQYNLYHDPLYISLSAKTNENIYELRKLIISCCDNINIEKKDNVEINVKPKNKFNFCAYI